MKVFLIGYPGDLGGANTEAWHVIKLWRQFGVEVHLVPTWRADETWKRRLDAIGCTTHTSSPEKVESVPGLPEAVTVGFCNPEYLRVAGRLRKLGCKIVWVNCMTFLFDHEKNFFRDHGPADAMVYQSEFQRAEIEPQLGKYKYNPATGHLIHGAFHTEDWEFRPRPHVHGDVFVLGRLARPDADKWSSNTWPIYNRIQYRSKRALMLGMDDRVHAKLGKPPTWADCLKPQAIPVQQFYSTLHCLLPVNGGAKENWPRAGLEAMAAGVPVVAQNEWGWREMILHGETGFLGSCDEELAHYSATLAYDENLRLRICKAARERLVDDLAKPEKIWQGWERLFAQLGQKAESAVNGTTIKAKEQ